MSRTSTADAIESIIDDGVDVQWDDRARSQATQSTRSVGEMVATTMGPFGRDKLVVNNGGNVHVTNDAVTILRNLHLTDPVSRTVREVANSQIFNAGDGTTTALVLASELMSHALDLCEEGLHPTSVIQGYRLAADAARGRLTDIATTYDLTDREVARDVARTTLAGSNATYEREHLAELAVRAVERVTDGYDVDLDAIRLRTAGGRDMAESRLVSGAMLEATPARRTGEHTTGEAEILVVDGSITREDTEVADVVDGATYDPSEFAAEGREWATQAAERIRESGATVLLCSGTVDDAVRERLRRHGVTCVTNVSDPDVRFLRRTFETRIPTTLDGIEDGDTVSGSVAYDWDEGRTTVTAPDARAVTVLLFSQSDAHREELESTMSDAVEVVAQVAYDGRVVPGGGAAEMEMARAVEAAARRRDDKAQLAAYAFADALETIPRVLVRNAGLDPIDRLNEQRAAHADGRLNAGIDLESGAVIDVTEHGVRDTLTVKRHAVSTSVDAACMLVRIDGIVEAAQQ
ncbi:TCP-1/cpn60 chaperonin family protein [Haloparvum sedimenti]|uniref:TCP-1/cpn60 chaperonin family protein n=1 Tax=Haloparvum sedimenti TaxID=1678448 RepID=UPI00071E70B3|nr:TCP-1/cpn60 chaperonin family protein [Haloparvum sedimenti]